MCVYIYVCIYICVCICMYIYHVVGPVTTAGRVLRLRIKERPPIGGGVAANKLNKQSRTADEGWSRSLGVVREANNPSL